ncbi:ribonuclease E activity regulator RraA [Actinosynnema sp. CS-041913]|uniref:ribonuclease E activity regulator RraA n=1 Tax=Actinosynnema sp. CS-041913 TaxID=3239917 RepID=UPI003D94393D
MNTSDLCDENDSALVLPVPLIRYGGVRLLDGRIETARTGDANQVIREVLAGPGENRILVVAGGGTAARYALVGDRLAARALEQGWQGIVVDGLVRDTDALADMPIGVWARGTWPRRGPVDGPGEVGVPVTLEDVTLRSGDRVVCDADGVVVMQTS